MDHFKSFFLDILYLSFFNEEREILYMSHCIKIDEEIEIKSMIENIDM
jgi:hypothetical protein